MYDQSDGRNQCQWDHHGDRQVSGRTERNVARRCGSCGTDEYQEFPWCFYQRSNQDFDWSYHTGCVGCICLPPESAFYADPYRQYLCLADRYVCGALHSRIQYQSAYAVCIGVGHRYDCRRRHYCGRSCAGKVRRGLPFAIQSLYRCHEWHFFGYCYFDSGVYGSVCSGVVYGWYVRSVLYSVRYHDGCGGRYFGHQCLDAFACPLCFDSSSERNSGRR